MPIPAAIVGQRLGPRSVTVTPRMIMAFAAATGDRNPRYFDDTRSEPLVAPPLLSVSLEWPLVLGMRSCIPEVTPEEARRGVHATHDATFHRLPRAGETLVTTATVVSVEQRPSGTRVIIRLDTVDAAGTPVTTTYNGGVYRGVELSGELHTIDEPPAVPEAAADGGLTIKIDVPIDAAHVYTECADIWNPIHTEQSVAITAGLPDVILHGTATLGYAAQEIVDRVCGGDPRRLRRITARFGAMVFMASELNVSIGKPVHLAEGNSTVGYRVMNAGGGPAIRDSIAIIV